MHIAIVEDAERTARLSLKGKLNIVGADEVAVPLAALSQAAYRHGGRYVPHGGWHTATRALPWRAVAGLSC